MTDAKILIIQDEHSSAKHLEEHLTGTAFHSHPRIEAHSVTHLEERLIALGYTVCASVSSAQEAIEKAAEMHPNLALIDLGLKGDAHGVAEQLSADIPVIFLTDGSEGDLLQRATHPFGYVLKPYEEQQLHLNIQTALSLHKRESKHKQTECEMEQKIDELQHRAQRLETILESISEGVIAVDENGDYLTFNSSAKQIIGSYIPGTDLNRRSEEYGLFLPDRVTLFPSADLPLARAIHGESSDDVEIFVRNPDLPGGTYVSISGRPLPPDESGVKGGVIVFRDISTEKETDAKLEQAVGELSDQTKLLETVLKNINNGVVLSDATNRILFMNASAKRILGIESDIDIPDIPVNERSETYGIFYADGKTRVPTDHLPLVRAVKGEKTEEITLFVRNKQNADGTYVRIRGIPVLNSDGTMVKAGLAILRDFTEHEKMKDRLAQIDGEPHDPIPFIEPVSDADNNGHRAKADSPDVTGNTEIAEKQEQIIEDLREELQLMEAVCDNLNEGIVVVSPMGKILFVNKTVEKIFGTWIVTPDQNEWSKTFGIYYPDIKTPIPVEQLPLTRALYGEETEEMEAFVQNKKNPEGTYIAARGRPILSSDESTIVAGLAVFRDLTQEKEADAKLEQANREQRRQTQLLETVFNSISDGVIVADAEGQFTIFNPSAEQIVGIGMLDTPPEQWTDQYGIFLPDQKTHLPTDQIPLVRAVQGHNTDDMELFIRNEKKPDGVYISVSGRPLEKDVDGHGGGVVVFHDITARKIAEAELEQTARKLRHQNELMETAFNNISDGIVIYDLFERSLHLNPGVTQITGIEGVTVPLSEWPRTNGVFYPDQKTLIKVREQPLARILFRGESIDNEDIFIRNKKKPEGVYIRANGRPLYNEDEIRGAVITFRDITEQKINEEALARAFAQGRLEIVDTILHNIGNAINSVTVGIETVHQHVVENPLIHRLCALADAIKAHRDDWYNYIQNDPQGQQVLPFVIALAEDFRQQDVALIKTVDRVKDRADHIADIIRTQETLDGPNMNLKDIDLRHALSMAIKVLQESLDKRGIETVIDCEDTTPQEIRIQESNFHQMMINLIKNSIEAIDGLAAAGGLNAPPRIHIRVYVRGNILTLEVEDNGIGIDIGNTRRIFASGYTTKESGSGLGLYSVANFILSFGGQIRALSDGSGKGTIIRIKLNLPSLLPHKKFYNIR